MNTLSRVLTTSPWRSWFAAARLPLLILYGVAAFAFAVAHFDTALPDDVRLMNTRIGGVEDSLDVLARGGPPLLGCTNAYTDDEADIRQQCFPTGTTDDQGIYLYLPLIGQLASETSPPLLLKWLFAWLMALPVLVAPLLFATLFKSTLIGLLAPLPLIYGFDFLQNTDIYWISAWAILLCLPLVLVVYDRERWDRASTALLLVAVALSGFASSIRSHAGLPILIAAALVILLRSRRWRTRALGVAALALAYFVTSSLVLTTVREYRDHRTGVDFSGTARTQHPFWHSMYLGLSYLPNPYGIKWSDTVALDAAARKNPNAPYLSAEYERTLRGLYLDIVRDNPGFVARTFNAKLRELVRQARAEFGLFLLFIPAMALIGRDRRRNQMLLLLTAPALAISLLPPLLTRPELAYGYNVGWLAAVGFTCFLATAWLICSGQRGASALMRADPDSLSWPAVRARLQELRPQWSTALRQKRVIGVAAAGIAVAAFALATGSADTAPQVDYAANATPLLPNADRQGRLVSEWGFESGVPEGWELIGDVTATPTAAGTNVATTKGTSEYQLMSDPVTLEPGNYRLDVTGNVHAGGLEIGALETASDSWINHSLFWWGQLGFESSTMTLPLALGTATRMQFVLANWNADRVSQWTIRRLRLVRE